MAKSHQYKCCRKLQKGWFRLAPRLACPADNCLFFSVFSCFFLCRWMAPRRQDRPKPKNNKSAKLSYGTRSTTKTEKKQTPSLAHNVTVSLKKPMFCSMTPTFLARLFFFSVYPEKGKAHRNNTRKYVEFDWIYTMKWGKREKKHFTFPSCFFAKPWIWLREYYVFRLIVFFVVSPAGLRELDNLRLRGEVTIKAK